MSLVLRFTRRFSMAHRLSSNTSRKCATPHGHNEHITVELISRTNSKLDGNVNMDCRIFKSETTLAFIYRQPS